MNKVMLCESGTQHPQEWIALRWTSVFDMDFSVALLGKNVHDGKEQEQNIWKGNDRGLCTWMGYDGVSTKAVLFVL